MTITEFLEARIAVDEAAARAATPGPWERPLNTRYKSSVTAEMPKGDPTSRWKGNVDNKGEPERVGVVSCQIWSDGKFFRKQSGRDLEHIARWDPARVLAERAAKRAILALHQGRADIYGGKDSWLCEMCTETGPNAQGWPCDTLKALAAVYSDHPDYDKDWAL